MRTCPSWAKTLVAPIRHLEGVTSEFSLDDYLALQGVVYQIAEALRNVITAERIYICSLGSKQGNSHVHWHLVALPPGVPLERQQTTTLLLENGVVSMTETQMAALANRIRDAIKPPRASKQSS